RQSLKGEELEGISTLSWLNHGRYELKGISEPIEICEVRATDEAVLAPPTTSEKARRVESPEGEAVLGWRPAVGQLVPNTQWTLETKLGEGGVVATDSSGVAWLWDLTTGREVGRFPPSWPRFARFQTDGNTLVHGSNFGLELLRVPTFAEITEMEKADEAT